jgi:hypothetical protein
VSDRLHRSVSIHEIAKDILEEILGIDFRREARPDESEQPATFAADDRGFGPDSPDNWSIPASRALHWDSRNWRENIVVVSQSRCG